MPHTPTLAGQARDVLTEQEASQRAARVDQARYDIKLDITAGRATYRGDVSVGFTVAGEGPLFIDFRGREIERLEVNGNPITPDWNGYRLTLPAGLAGDTLVRIKYENDYDTTGDGFHRFVDPEDGQEYVYTNFEPYEAHRLFPCFDQPDIKGRYTIEVTAPVDWQLVSSAPLIGSTPAGDDRATHRFAQTELFSTYLFALVGGPYVAQRHRHGDLDLGLFARRSMERYLIDQAPEIFEITGQGLDFFAEQFDQPYPFAKYDQVFVPEYNSGAMENVGCVTYHESYLFRDPATENQKLDRAETFLHELAHMWFGNLVTMRWWNDLWLNESFATYVSNAAMAEATRFTNAWNTFYDTKRWAYAQDQLPTTHPISGEAADTEIAFLNFDGITYGKGASVLKQLVKYIGRDAFRDGMRSYFRRHGWSNATLSDFLTCLEESSGQSLDEWARLWLRTASVNTLSTEWQAEEGQITALAIAQSAPPDYPTLRPHALELALGREGPDGLEIQAIPAWIDGPDTPIAEARGLAAPDLAFPNFGDYAYAKVSLDATSLAYVRHNLDRVGDTLLRQLLWMSLWEMVRDRELRSTDFLAIGRTELPDEPDLDVLNTVLGRVALIVTRFLPDAQLAAESHGWFEAALENASRSEGDRQIMWARSAITSALSVADIERLIGLVDGNDAALTAMANDQDMRWAVATRALAFGLPDADALLAREEERDPSDRGKRAMLLAQAARPTADAKAEVWARINGEGYGSFHLTRSAMMGFIWPHQAELLEPYVDRYFDNLRDIFETRDHPYARAYLLALYPAYRSQPEVLRRSHELIASLDGSLPTLSRQLLEVADDLDRQIRVREFAATDG